MAISNNPLDNEQKKFAVDGSGNVAVRTLASGFGIYYFDYISLSYTGSNLTGVVFKTGGSGGTAVATLALAYTGSNLTSVTKT